MAHGLLGSERIVVTPEGGLAITEYILAEGVQHLGLSVAELWRHFGIAARETAEGPRLDAGSDLVQIGLLARVGASRPSIARRRIPGRHERAARRCVQRDSIGRSRRCCGHGSRVRSASRATPFASMQEAQAQLEVLLPGVAGGWSPRLLPRADAPSLAAPGVRSGCRRAPNRAAPGLGRWPVDATRCDARAGCPSPAGPGRSRRIAPAGATRPGGGVPQVEPPASRTNRASLARCRDDRAPSPPPGRGRTAGGRRGRDARGDARHRLAGPRGPAAPPSAASVPPAPTEALANAAGQRAITQADRAASRGDPSRQDRQAGWR